MSEPLLLTGESLTLENLVEVAFRGRAALLSADAGLRIDASRAVIDRAVREDRVVYGVTTGFGKFSDVVIPREKRRQLQRNLVESHAKRHRSGRRAEPLFFGDGHRLAA